MSTTLSQFARWNIKSRSFRKLVTSYTAESAARPAVSYPVFMGHSHRRARPGSRIPRSSGSRDGTNGGRWARESAEKQPLRELRAPGSVDYIGRKTRSVRSCLNINTVPGEFDSFAASCQACTPNVSGVRFWYPRAFQADS